jgi:hypothetical protein|tara:strand:- start:206 stop:592 length:387 start_codon:yes stop_codon:yes gene_type:complete
MIEDDFYCTIKFKSGDEIFAKIAAEEDDDRTMLLVSNPIMVEEIKVRGTVIGHKFEPWLKSTKEDMFIVNIDDVLTMSESEDIEMILYYQDYIRKMNKGNHAQLDRKMGYLSTVQDAKEVLEKLYKSS